MRRGAIRAVLVGAAARRPATSLLLACGLLGGCPTFTTMGTARTIPKGTRQCFAAGGWLRDVEAPAHLNVNGVDGAPYLEMGCRYGVADGVELGGKIFTPGSELSAKLALVRPEGDGGLAISVAPAASVYHYTLDDGHGRATFRGFFHLPVLFGIGIGRNELVIAPRLSVWTYSHGSNGGILVTPGGSAGFAWRIADGIRLLPEVSTELWPIVTFNLGLLVGGD